MKKTATNILKATLGKLHLRKGASHNHSITWLASKVLKHQEDRKEKKILLEGLIVFYRRPYELLHTYTEIFTQGIYHFRAANPEPLIVDCGSNIGIGLLNYKQQYPQARIIAFEPDAINFALLQKNVAHNNLQKVSLHQSAVWIDHSTLNFSAQGSEASQINSETTTGQKVQGIRLADVLAQESVIDFLKIDIEGAEWPVIQDCAPQLHKVRHLFLEYHGKTKDTHKISGILKILEATGFAVYVQNAADNLRKPFLQQTTNTIYDVQLNLYCFKS